MSEARIAGTGIHLPRYRLPAAAVREAWDDGPGIERRTVPAADEDALTMAVAATRRALAAAGLDADAVAGVALASTTPPVAEGELVPRLARALGLAGDLRASTHTQSPAGAADAVLAAAGTDGPAVAVAADAPAAEPPADAGFGAGAAALVLAADGPVALSGRGHAGDETPGVRSRAPDSGTVERPGATGYRRDAARRLSAAAVAALDDAADGRAPFEAAALYQPDPRTPGRIAGALDRPLAEGAVAAGTVVGRTGDAGAATVPLGLLAGLASLDPGDRALAVPFGGGARASALAVRVDEPVTTGVEAALAGGEPVGYDRSLRLRGHLGEASVPGGGSHVSLPAWRRSLDGRYLRGAGRCPDCGRVTFPARGACPGCHARVAYERVPLAREGRIEAVTTIGRGGAPPEFAGLERRAGGYAAALVSVPVRGAPDERVRLPATCTDCEPGAVARGDRVRATVRRLYAEEGVVRYATKFVPVRPGGDG